MKLKYYNGAGPVSFWLPNWTDTYSPDLVVTGYEVAFIDGFDVLLVEYVDFSDFSYKYFAFVIDETYYDYQLEGIIVIEKDLFGNVNPLFILEDFSFSSSTLDGLFANAYIAIADFRNLTRFSDIIEGNDYSNRLEAGRGNDTIYGNGGNDFIFDDAGNDLYFGGSGSDTFYATNTFSGINKVYGGSGSDYLFIDPDLRVTRAVDTFGDYFTKGTEYIVVQNNSGSSIMRASSIEFIQENNGPVASVSSYNYDFFYYVLLDSNIPDKNYSSSQWSDSNIFIDLDDYLASINYGETTKYSISLSNTAYLDQFSISNNQLKIENGSGTTRTVDVTVSAVNITSNGNVRNNDVATTDTFKVTFKDNNSSSSAYSGTSGDDERTLTSGNDTWQVGDGFDTIDGGSGIDTIIVPDKFDVTNVKDVTGSVTGFVDKKYIRLNDNDGNNTYAINFEKITYKGETSNLSSFADTARYDVVSVEIPDRELSDNQTSNIFLSDYFFTINATASLSYSIQSSDNEELIDQVTLTGATLRLDSGSVGSTQTIKLTIRATQEFSDDYTFFTPSFGYEEQTFIVTMRDDNYSGTPGNDILKLSSGNDEINATTGRDQIDGGLGVDTLKIKLADKIIYSIDKNGSYTGIKGKDYIHVQFGDDAAKYTSAINFEKIAIYKSLVFKESGETTAIYDTYDLNDFVSTSYWGFGDGNNIPDQTLEESSNIEIILDDYLYHINHPSQVGISYSFESSNNKLSDQISINNGIIKLSSGTSGNNETTNITITAKLVDNKVNIDEDWEFSTLSKTFSVTMKDDDADPDIDLNTETLTYSLSSSKNENGPILNEFSSTSTSSGTLNHSSNSEIIVLTGQAGTIRGLAGDDTYFVSDLITANSSISIVDTSGDNIIQIPDNTLIEKALFASSATRLTLSNDAEITINGADKFTFNVSGNSIAGDKGENFSYTDFVKLFGAELSSQTQTIEGVFYTKSDSTSSSSFNIINISGNEDTSFKATSAADEFRYEINNDGTSAEGAYTFEIQGFDKTNDKLVLVNKTGTSKLTTQEFDSINNVEVTSDGISGTQILFAPDSSGQSGKLTIKDVDESFSGNWTANTYDVEIIPISSLSSTSDETSYEFSFSVDSSDPILEEFSASSFSGTLNYSDQNDLIILTGSGETARGLGGDDTYFVSNLIPKNSKISIVDTNGENTIQISDNTFISETLFTKNATRLTLNDGKEITISNADTFNFNLGGNKTTGDSGVNLNYEEFASAFGVEDVLSLSSSVNGTIVDQYII